MRFRIRCLGSIFLCAAGCGSSTNEPSGTTARDTTDATAKEAMPPVHEEASDETSTSDAVATGAADAADAGTATNGLDSAIAGWTLTWSDEFDGADGTAADASRWAHDVGGSGWGNDELEYYTDGSSNAAVLGGNLVITAKTDGASAYSCSYGPCKYTSARLKTQGLFAQEAGRFEARIQIPAGQGLWPAFWLLGDDIDDAGWPACGEVDIMENIGKEPGENHGSLHAPGFPGAGLTGMFALPGGAKLSAAFHTYAVEWDASSIRFYVDDQLYETQTPAGVPSGGTWEFNHPFFILLNVAVGGSWPGNPDGTTTFPQTMKVDWVRVYTKST